MLDLFLFSVHIIANCKGSLAVRLIGFRCTHIHIHGVLGEGITVNGVIIRKCHISFSYFWQLQWP